MVFAVAALLAPPPPAASAHADPTIAVRLTGVSPSLPPQVDVAVLDGGELTYAELTNRSEDPVYALDPEGAPFLEVSADGVYGDLGSPYLAASPRASSDRTVMRPCCPNSEWVLLSIEQRWTWADPRLDPPLRRSSGDDRGLGALDSGEPLATWEIGLERRGERFEASGVLERRVVGEVTTTIDTSPPEVDVSVIASRPPQVRIRVADDTDVEVVSDDGRSFIRVDARGARGDLSSPDYQAHLRGIGVGEVDGEGWVPLAGGGPDRATWVDLRLSLEEDIPTTPTEAHRFAHEWSIPLLVDGAPARIGGRSVWEPADPPVLDEQSAGFWDGADRQGLLIAGGLTLAVVAAYVAARARGTHGPTPRQETDHDE